MNSEGDLLITNLNMWGDWPAHFTMGSSFTTRGIDLKDSPFIYNQPFSYPFTTNLLSALLIMIGVPFFTSFILPSYLATIFLILMVYIFLNTLLKSKKLAALAATLFLCNGGTGVFLHLSNQNSPSILDALSSPVEFTNYPSLGIRYISVINSMILPQRAFTLGFPLSLVVLTLVYRWLFLKQKPNKVPLLLTGALFGLLPIIHTHSFLAVCCILFFWFSWGIATHKKEVLHFIGRWVAFLIPAVLLPLLIIKVVFLPTISHDFGRWGIGWLATEFKIGWLTFWFRNWTVVPALALISFLLHIFQRNKKSAVQEFFTYGPFIFLFIAINVYIFQPWSWDNTKLLTWVSLGFSALVAVFFKQALSYTHTIRNYVIKVAATVALVVLLLFIISSGAIDAYKVLNFKNHTTQMYSAQELQLAEWVKERTSPKSIWLANTYHTHWLFNLTGRKTLMTYEGWLWTHGYDTSQMPDIVKSMYENPSENRAFFDRFSVNYVVVDWQQKDTFSSLDEFRFIHGTRNYRIYQYTATPEN